MKNPQVIRLYRLNELFNTFKNRVLNIQELMDKIEVGERTLKGDLQVLREEYDAPIVWDAKRRGYCYTEPFDLDVRISLNKKDVAALHTALRILEQYNQLSIFQDIRGAISKIENSVKFHSRPNDLNKFIQLEEVPFFKGSELIPIFVEATQQHSKIIFSHQRFDSEAVRQHEVLPYLLKEYRNRWYLVAWSIDYQQIRIYGLDRVVQDSIQVITGDFEAPEFDAEQYFRYSLGITVYPDKHPEDVVLSFDARQGKYFKTQPFYSFTPDDILIDNETELRVRLRIIVNEELIRAIAQFGKDVEVIEPASLRETMKDYFKQSFEVYK
ncbi:MAG: helix-turn-helix transcriptional regulator [Spirosomataceae bacterium]